MRSVSLGYMLARQQSVGLGGDEEWGGTATEMGPKLGMKWDKNDGCRGQQGDLDGVKQSV
jgi:hypothetical protein